MMGQMAALLAMERLTGSHGDSPLIQVGPAVSD